VFLNFFWRKKFKSKKKFFFTYLVLLIDRFKIFKILKANSKKNFFLRWYIFLLSSHLSFIDRFKIFKILKASSKKKFFFWDDIYDRFKIFKILKASSKKNFFFEIIVMTSWVEGTKWRTNSSTSNWVAIAATNKNSKKKNSWSVSRDGAMRRVCATSIPGWSAAGQ